MSLSKLIQIVPPPLAPIETGSPKQWEAIQNRLGIHLPADYKEFIDTYGTGRFNDFILPYNPFAAREDVNTLLVLDAHHEAAHRIQMKTNLKWSAVAPYELYPTPGGLFPWGTTDHFGHSFFWQVNGPPETWVTVFYDMQSGEYEVWKMPFVSFLVRLFSREIESVLLPNTFPPELIRIRYTQFMV